jgi:hypothetical protein
MKDQSLVPGHDITVTKKSEDKHSTTYVVRPSSPQKETPEWVELVIEPHEATEITVIPVDKNGKQVGQPQTKKVTDSKKPVDIVFPSPVKADHLEVVAVHPDAKHTDHAEVHHAVACIELPGKHEETTHVAGTTTPHVDGTTHASGTTPAAGTTTPTHTSPCTKNMKNQGLVPSRDLKVTKTTHKKSTTVVIEPKTPQKSTPEWNKVTLAPTDAKEVQYTPEDKNGKPIGETKTVKVTDSKKSVVLVFPESLKADKIVIVVVYHDAAHPSRADVVSAVACIEPEETTTHAATTSTAVPHPPTTPHVPAPTTSHAPGASTPGSSVTTTTVS